MTEESGRRRRHRRVVALSDVDRKRLAAGEITDPVEALHAGDAPPTVDAPATAPAGETGRPSADDERFLRELPPHWGRR